MAWWTGKCECGICGHRDVSVVEIDDEHDEPIVPLECSGCGGMTMRPDYDDEADGGSDNDGSADLAPGDDSLDSGRLL